MVMASHYGLMSMVHGTDTEEHLRRLAPSIRAPDKESIC